MTWISLKEAAKRMHVNRNKLAARREDGQWKHYPDLARRQDAPRCAILFIEREVDDWCRRAMENAVRRAVPYRSLVLDSDFERGLRALGSVKVLKAFGFIPSNAAPPSSKKRGRSGK